MTTLSDRGYTIRSVRFGSVKEILYRYHYADRMPQPKFTFGLIARDEVVGCVTYSIPASYTLCKGVCGAGWNGSVLELSRVCLGSEEGKNLASWFVSRTMSRVEGNWILVSYADPYQGHVGYIYQALGWIYTGHGSAEPAWIHPITGELVSNTRRHIDKKAEALGLDWHELIKEPREGKHRYVTFIGDKRTRKAMRRDLRYKAKAYPKGDTRRFCGRSQVDSAQKQLEME